MCTVLDEMRAFYCISAELHEMCGFQLNCNKIHAFRPKMCAFHLQTWNVWKRKNLTRYNNSLVLFTSCIRKEHREQEQYGTCSQVKIHFRIYHHHDGKIILLKLTLEIKYSWGAECKSVKRVLNNGLHYWSALIWEKLWQIAVRRRIFYCFIGLLLSFLEAMAVIVYKSIK